jgi:glutamine amidotransferase
MIVIVDYGIGNLGSISNMLKRIGVLSCTCSDPHDIALADKLIFPGVGSFDNGMKNIKERGLLPILNERVLDKRVPILGICLGMQLMTRKSEEGNQSGLGWIDAETVKFSFNDSLGLKIPHMGWNSVKSIPGSALFNGIEADNRFYFVHSYHVVCDHPGNILGRTEYGFSFTSAVIKDNIYGVQFHPEKSHKYGMRLLQNYCFR